MRPFCEFKNCAIFIFGLFFHQLILVQRKWQNVRIVNSKTVQYLSVIIGAEFLSSEELAVFFSTVKEVTPQIRYLFGRQFC